MSPTRRRPGDGAAGRQPAAKPVRKGDAGRPGGGREAPVTGADPAGERAAAAGGPRGETLRRQRVERELLASEARFRMMLEQASDAIIITDGELRILEVNPRTCDLLGRTREELLCLRVHDLPTAEDLADHPLEIARLHREMSLRTVRRLRRADGTSVLVETSASRMPDGRVLATLRDVGAREQGERALRESEARYRAVVEQASDGISITDAEWRFLDVNPRFCELMGHSREELLAMSVRDIAVPENLASEPLHDELLARGTTVMIERPMRRRDGSTFTAEISARGIGEGRVLSVVRDVTARRLAERALRESEERFRSVFDSDLLGILFGRQGGAIEDANDYLLRMLGYTREDLRAGRLRWDSLMSEEALPRLVEVVRQARENTVCSPFESELVRADGTRVPVLCGAAFLGTTRDFGVGFVLDLTELKRTEQRLAASEDYLERAQRLAHVGSWDADLATMTSRYSAEMLRIHGLPLDTPEVRFEQFLATIHPDDRERVERAIREAMGRPGEHHFDHRVVRPDGSVRVVQATSQTVLDPSGRPVRIIGAVQDVTERRLLELQLREAQQLEAIGRLAGGVAHDFNNLLTVILGFTESLLEELPPGDGRRASAEQVRAAGRRAVDLTQQLLAFGRRQVMLAQVFDLHGVLQEMRDILRRLVGERIELALALEARQCRVRADRAQIERVVMNLALNARDAMPAGGRLGIATADAERAADPGRPEGRELLLTVSDTGEGMSPEVQTHIFEPFFTTKEVGRGAGLGLATVHGIVSQTGGRIEVSSAEGRGSTFRVFLPCAADESAGEPAEAPSGAPGARGDETVLLVEDEAAVRRFVAQALGRQGYRVLEADEGDRAIDVAHRHAGPIHLLVTDLMMPGMTGRELARYLARVRPGLRVLYISGHADERAGPRPGPDEAEAFLQKPFTAATLADRVRRVLDGPPPPPPPGPGSPAR